MEKFPFTPLGVSSALDYLYKLPDNELQAEATSIRSDFKGWINQKFDLSSSQSLFLSNIEKRTSQYYGDQCSFCFVDRLPIILDYPAPPSTPGYAKWIEATSSIKASSDGNGNNLASGELIFKIIYA